MLPATRPTTSPGNPALRGRAVFRGSLPLGYMAEASVGAHRHQLD
jgi:hypothetical protein